MMFLLHSHKLFVLTFILVGCKCNDREPSRIKEWTSIHVFCRTAELAFIKHSTDPGRSIRISEYHKNTIFTILSIYLTNRQI